MLLNLDAGELDDETDALWSHFDLLHCACGGHAGDARSIARVVDFVARSAIRLGAHPSYPDRANFGRRSMTIAPDALAASITAQCQLLGDIAAARGVAVTSIKPHGALYHDARADSAIADAVIRGATAVLGPVTIVGPPHGSLRVAAEHRALPYAREGFADRRMQADGTLVPRTEPDALITDPTAAAAQARALTGVDTICIHADTPNAIAIAQAVRAALRRNI